MGIAELDYRRHAEVRERLAERLHRELVQPCDKCGGTGSTVERAWDEAADMPDDRINRCTCTRERLHRVALHEAGLPEEFWQADAIIPTFNERAFRLLHMYADHLDDALRHGLGLIMTGKNGTGKTSSACVAVIAAIRQGRTAALVSWPDYVDGLRRSWRDPVLARHLDERGMRDLLVIDELGKEHETNDASFVAGKLDSLLRLRRGALLPTILTTNLTAAQLIKRYGASIESLLADRFKTVPYRPGDFRVKVERDWDEMLTGKKGGTP